MKLSLAFSPCPNDTFIFDAWVNGRLPQSEFEPVLHFDDILHLNERARRSELDVIKVSYNTLGHLLNEYQLLRSGGALGKGCGPLLVARPGTTLESLARQNAVIAIPGFNTTANLLLSFFAPQLKNKVQMLFHEVMPAVERGDAAAGLIIHENRFTYARHGLVSLADLGEYWEQQTGLPIPLGAIAAKKSLGAEAIRQIESLIRASVQYAFDHPQASAAFVAQHSQEMDPEVCQQHIALYVNEYSLDIGTEGEKAIEALFQVGVKEGILPADCVRAFRNQMNRRKDL